MVEEEGETVEVINRGKIIARLVPANQTEQITTEETNRILADLNRLATELAPYWPENVDAVEAIRDVRREL